MASVQCPACGERVKVREAASRLRCQECGKSFRVDEDEDEEGEELSPRAKRYARKKKPSLKLPLIIIGSVFGVAILAVVVILIVRSGKDGEGQAGEVKRDQSKVTLDNFRRVKQGMDLAEVESILGGSVSSSEEDMRNGFRALGEIQAGFETGWARFAGASDWRRWDGKGFRVWVAFVKDKDGKLLAAFSTALEDTGGKPTPHNGIQTFAGNSDLAEENEQRKKEEELRKNPKWVRGAKARTLLLADWRDKDANGYVFNAGEKLRHFDTLGMDQHGKEGTFRILDDSHVEIVYPPLHPSLKAVPQRYEFLVNQDELMLIHDTQNTIIPIRGPYYRMPAKAGSPGYTAVIEPIVAGLKSTNQTKRYLAFHTLRRLGKSGVSALPTLIDLVRGTDVSIATEAAGIIAGFEELGAPAVSVLVGELRDLNSPKARTVVFTLGRIGPPAKEALPTLRACLAKTQDFSQYPLRDALTEAIARIEGKKP